MEIYSSLLLRRTLTLLQAGLEGVLIGMTSTETCIPLGTIQGNTFACMCILVLRIKVTDLGALGRLVEGMQCWEFVAQDKQSNVKAILSQSQDVGGICQQNKEDVGEFHGRQKEAEGKLRML